MKDIELARQLVIVRDNLQKDINKETNIKSIKKMVNEIKKLNALISKISWTMKLLELKEALNEAYLNFYYTRDESYYALFYKLTHKFLKNFIRKYYIKSLVDCEDVIAEVYEIMYTKVNLFSDEYAPYNWMTTIAVNQALQKIKQRKKTNAVEILDDKYSINEGYRYAEYTEELYVAIEQLTYPHKSIV